MTTEGADDELDQPLADLLADLDAALARGAKPSADEPSLPPDQLNLFRLARESLLHLELAWPRGAAPAPDNAPRFDLLTGTGRVGKFHIDGELGRGGTGIVFRATDTTTGQVVALKLPRLEALLDPDLRRRFLDEARHGVGLDHPALVPVYEAGEIGGVCYIASAFAGESNLFDWIESQHGPVPQRTAAALVANLARGVQYLHDHHILHRDIKPSNILLGPPPDTALPDPDLAVAGTPRLTDFGLAKLLDAVSPTTDPATGGLILGTAEYMAPEQADGRNERLGRATDVYGLGAVLYELLAGRTPFHGRNKFDTLRQLMTLPPIPPRRLRPDLSRELEAVCLKCLEKEPSRRYATAGLLADDLQRFLAGHRTTARPLPWWRQSWRWAARHPRLAIAAAIGPLAVAGAFGFIRAVEQAREEELWPALFAAEPSQLPPILDRIRRSAHARPPARPAVTDSDRFREALVRARYDTAAAVRLRYSVAVAEPWEIRLIVDALSERREESVADWSSALRGSGLSESARLRIAAALVRFAPDAALDAETCRAIQLQLLAELPWEAADWAKLLSPAKALLLPGMRERFADPSRPAAERESVAAVLAEWHRDNFAELVSCLATADDRQFPHIAAVLVTRPASAIAALEAALARPPADPIRAARARANWALMLDRLGRSTASSGLLRDDPAARNQYIAGVTAARLEPRALAARLFATPHPTVRYALLLALGEFDPARIPSTERTALIERILHMYCHDPDSGVHSAAGWLLEHWSPGTCPIVRRPPGPGCRWFTTSAGQTLAILPDSRPPVAIGCTEVTEDQFRVFLAEHQSSRGREMEPGCPAGDLKYWQAAAYCNWLTERELSPADRCYVITLTRLQSPSVERLPGRTGYRLPSVDEWDRAASADSRAAYFFGDASELLPRFAWIYPNSGRRSHPVGRLRPNSLGLFDVYGNVAEWCDPSDTELPPSHAVVKGRSLRHDADDCRSDQNRLLANKQYHDIDIGFRLARELPEWKESGR